jgi:hypothetical protein
VSRFVSSENEPLVTKEPAREDTHLEHAGRRAGRRPAAHGRTLADHEPLRRRRTGSWSRGRPPVVSRSRATPTGASVTPLWSLCLAAWFFSVVSVFVAESLGVPPFMLRGVRRS